MFYEVVTRSHSLSHLPVILLVFGEHDNGGALLLPDHSPEVVLCVWEGTLGGYELPGTIVTLCA